MLLNSKSYLLPTFFTLGAMGPLGDLFGGELYCQAESIGGPGPSPAQCQKLAEAPISAREAERQKKLFT